MQIPITKLRTFNEWVKTIDFITSDQGTRINKTAKITVKGQEYFINKFLKK